MGTWKTLRSAPRDGTYILVATKTEKPNSYFRGRVRMAKWRDGRWDGGAGQFWDDDALCAWQELPQPPVLQYVGIEDMPPSLLTRIDISAHGGGYEQG
jgi:hypothetical protein